ncbi:MAG TPA: hypothetical protein VK437_11170 [Steroidobacteraceae bacterium]|nr:hypothetical protein [Steroidobacteraceae bacterium]
MLIDSKPDSVSRTEEGPKRRSRQPWHSVCIVAGADACSAALACKAKRFLSSEAPRLPLAECDSPQCRCRYRHFADRRANARRASERGMPTARVADERRGTRGRRATD